MTDPKTPRPPRAESELSAALRQRIDALDSRLDSMDYYAVLGLGRDATRAMVRSALLTSAASFHPDRYFGRAIDPDYKRKMERLFSRMALAHDTLVDDARRAAYDRTLPPPLPSSASPGRPPPLPEGYVSSMPPPEEPASPAEGPGARGHGSVRVAAAVALDFERTRAQAFASRIAGGGARLRPPTPAHSFPVPALPGASSASPRAGSEPTLPPLSPQAAVEALRRRYEESVARATARPTSSHVPAAEAAATRGDHPEAARLFHLAAQETTDPDARAALAQAEARVREQGRDAAMRRARELEQRQEYAPAAAAWSRAYELSPGAELAWRAAQCFRRSGTDMRRAARLAEDAVKLDPSKQAYRVALALIYADAGLVLRARGEIERALAMDPKNAAAREAAQRIKSMG